MKVLCFESPCNDFNFGDEKPGLQYQITHFYLEVSQEFKNQDFLLIIIVNTENGDRELHYRIKPSELLELEYFPLLYCRRNVKLIKKLEIYHPSLHEQNLMKNNIINGIDVISKIKIFLI